MRKKTASNIKKPASKLIHADKFYREPCWLDVWRDGCDPYHFTFWRRINEPNALILISHLEAAGFLIRPKNQPKARCQVHPTYYSQLKFYCLKPKIITKRVIHIKNTPYFLAACKRIWMSMRILRTFSIGQIQACSNVYNDTARIVVRQLYQLNYARLIAVDDAYFRGNEDIYQLICDTGAKAPLLCADGILYDLNTCCIYYID